MKISELYVSNKFRLLLHPVGPGARTLGRVEVVRAEPGEASQWNWQWKVVGIVHTGAVYTCENGTFILLNWNIILQCYICE